MRKLRVFESISVDGYFTDRDGDIGWAHAGREDPEFSEWVGANASGGKLGQFLQAIRDGNIVATIFFLKTKARHRGYSERLELIPLNPTIIEVELGRPISEIENHHASALNGNSPAVALLEQSRALQAVCWRRWPWQRRAACTPGSS